MKKQDLGSKRACLKCGAKFYDFARDPIVCPKCEASFTSAEFAKAVWPGSRVRSSRVKSKPVPETKEAVDKADDGDDDKHTGEDDEAVA